MTFVGEEKWLERVRNDDEIRTMAKPDHLRFLLKYGRKQILWDVVDGSINTKDRVSLDDVWNFTVDVPEAAWEKFFDAVPYYNTLQAMVAMVDGVVVEGDRTCWAQSINLIERILFLAKGKPVPPMKDETTYRLNGITGRYVNVSVDDANYDIYYEEAGDGQDVIFLHTAGSDSRQYKYILGNAQLQRGWHMIAFDLPYHGRSEPPNGWWATPYMLTTELYVKWILGFMTAVGIYEKKPIICGSSMGGAIVLYLAHQYGQLFNGAISLEGGFGAAGRRVHWTDHPKVHAGLFLGSWVAGLMAPQSPEYRRRLVLWEYAQGGPGVYYGDTYFYSTDFPKVADKIGKTNCPLWILSGEYDYSCTTEMSRAAAAKMNAEFVEMKGIGHFPMTENPSRFLEYFRPILERASAR